MTDQDVEGGSTPQTTGKPLPLKLSPDAMKQGWLYLYRGPVLVYQNKVLHIYLRQAVYGNDGLVSRFEVPLTFGLATVLIQLPFSTPKDIRRRKEMKYGRLLKGPLMVTPRQFNRAVNGTGIGIKTDDCKEPLREHPANSRGATVQFTVNDGNGENEERASTSMTGEEDSNAVPFPRPQPLLGDAKTLQ
ncbi:MAG: hypothetical protein WA869_06095 [Alloacidobacterium sp.]